MMRRAVTGALLGGALLVALTACAGAPVPDDVASYVPQSSAGSDALLEGVLVREDGCTYVDDPATGTRTLPVFPAGSVSWSDDLLKIGDETFRVGEVVGFGGGEWGGVELSIPDACASEPARFVVNPPY